MDDFILDIEEKLDAMRDLRIQAGYSQQELADLLGIHQSRIARWERGEWRRSPHIRTFIGLVRLIDQLQLAVQDDATQISVEKPAKRKPRRTARGRS